MVTNSLCIYHGRKEKEKEERRKENIPEDNDRGLQGYSGDYELSKLSSGSRAWKTNDARGKSFLNLANGIHRLLYVGSRSIRLSINRSLQL